MVFFFYNTSMVTANSGKQKCSQVCGKRVYNSYDLSSTHFSFHWDRVFISSASKPYFFVNEFLVSLKLQSSWPSLSAVISGCTMSHITTSPQLSPSSQSFRVDSPSRNRSEFLNAYGNWILNVAKTQLVKMSLSVFCWHFDINTFSEIRRNVSLAASVVFLPLPFSILCVT